LEKRQERVALAYQSRHPRHSTDAALAAATKIDLRGSVCFCRYDALIAPASRMLEHNFNPVVVSVMTDPIEEIVAPAAIERAMSVFEQFKDRDHCELSQARKALRDFVFGQVAKGETDEKRLIVSGLTHLKQLEKQTAK
jgi:hypothetical protein